MSKLHSEMYEDLFQIEEQFEDNVQERIEKLRDKQIIKYRMKTIKSGDVLECEIYPIWKTVTPGTRVAVEKASRKAQKNLNDRNAQKHLVRLINTNFTKDDIWATFTYEDGKVPASPEAAKKDMQNYIRRAKRHMKKHGLGELKYVYVTEFTRNGEKIRVHHHIVMNLRDRDAAEAIWQNGAYTHTRRLQPNDFGLTGLAKYITKEKHNTKVRETSKRYSVSRNLKQPTITVADSKITRRRVEKIAQHDVDPQQFFEAVYKDYTFKNMDVKYSHYVSGAYLYAQLKKFPNGRYKHEST